MLWSKTGHDSFYLVILVLQYFLFVITVCALSRQSLGYYVIITLFHRLVRENVANKLFISTKNLLFFTRAVFHPGGIHREEVYNFWRDELKAGDWVLKTLREGYEIPFSHPPTSYEERNNSSARENEDKVREIVFEMIESQIVEKMEQKPLCVSPLGLVSKLKDGKMKHRLVWDASRHLNLILEKQKVKLAHLDKALELTNHQDFQVIFDLKSAYYHIKIKESSCQYLDSSIKQEDGSPLYFIYKHLPFGLSSAVHAITKLWKP